MTRNFILKNLTTSFSLISYLFTIKWLIDRFLSRKKSIYMYLSSNETWLWQKRFIKYNRKTIEPAVDQISRLLVQDSKREIKFLITSNAFFVLYTGFSSRQQESINQLLRKSGNQMSLAWNRLYIKVKIYDHHTREYENHLIVKPFFSIINITNII